MWVLPKSLKHCRKSLSCFSKNTELLTLENSSCFDLKSHLCQSQFFKIIFFHSKPSTLPETPALQTLSWQSPFQSWHTKLNTVQFLLIDTNNVRLSFLGFIFKDSYFIYLKLALQREGETEDFHPVVHSANGCNDLPGLDQANYTNQELHLSNPYG